MSCTLIIQEYSHFKLLKNTILTFTLLIQNCMWNPLNHAAPPTNKLMQYEGLNYSDASLVQDSLPNPFLKSEKDYPQ